MAETVDTCSASEVTEIQTHITVLTTALVKISALITQYQKESIFSVFLLVLETKVENNPSVGWLFSEGHFFENYPQE